MAQAWSGEGGRTGEPTIGVPAPQPTSPAAKPAHPSNTRPACPDPESAHNLHHHCKEQ